MLCAMTDQNLLDFLKKKKKNPFEIQIFIAKFGICMKNALKLVLASLVSMQWFLRQPLKFWENRFKFQLYLKVDMPILTCRFFTNNWLTLTSEMHFVKFHPEVASCLLSRGWRKYAPLGMRLIWKYINYFLVYQLISHFLSYLQNYKEFKAKILDLQLEKYGLSFDIKKCTTSGWALGDENVIGIRAFNTNTPLLGHIHKT